MVHDTRCQVPNIFVNPARWLRWAVPSYKHEVGTTSTHPNTPSAQHRCLYRDNILGKRRRQLMFLPNSSPPSVSDLGPHPFAGQKKQTCHLRRRITTPLSTSPYIKSSARVPSRISLTFIPIALDVQKISAWKKVVLLFPWPLYFFFLRHHLTEFFFPSSRKNLHKILTMGSSTLTRSQMNWGWRQNLFIFFFPKRKTTYPIPTSRSSWL